MPRWKIISGARPFYSFPNRERVAEGWARDLQRGDVQLTVNVVVSIDAQQAAELPQESRDAIKSHGRSVINGLLQEEELPYVVDVTPSGLVRDYERPATEAEASEDEDGDDDAAVEKDEPSDLDEPDLQNPA